MKKPVKIGLWLLGFVVLGLLGLWLEHERAKARLAAFKQELRSKGERLTYDELRLSSVAAGSNGAADFLKLAAKLPSPSSGDSDVFAPGPMRSVEPGKARVAWREERLPTQGLKDRFIEDSWPSFSAHFAEQRELVLQLHQPLARERFYFDDFHRGDEIMPVNLTTDLVRGMDWLVSATLHDLRYGQPEDAYQHLLAASRLVQRWDDGHLLVTLLIANRNLHRASSVVWEALQFPGWSDAQLAQLQTVWTSVRWLETLQRGCAGELCWAVNTYGQARQFPGRLASLGVSAWPFDDTFADWWIKVENAPVPTLVGNTRALVWPMWSSYGDELHALRWATATLAGWRASSSNYNHTAGTNWWSQAELLRTNASPWHLLAVSGAESPFSLDPTARFVLAEVVQEMTVVAIALRRHQLRHGRHPAQLSELVPAILPVIPRDFMDGKPLRYRREPDDRFRLWSVGENGLDDGGNPDLSAAPVKQESFLFGGRTAWYYGRDVVWPQPATHDEVQRFHQSLRTKK